jgi:GDPmannose 4,6-dehydratase
MKALITGITGQDGSYLSELLLDKGYEVHGVIRRSSSFNTGRIDHIFDRLNLHHGDITDGESCARILSAIEPDEVYHLAAQSQVRVSFDMPIYTGEVTAIGAARMLEAIRCLKKRPKFYNAASSEMFGNAPAPQNEDTPFDPRSPYACAKVYAYQMTKNYREAYGMFAVSGILFNHESPRRGETFVTRKITRAIGRILRGEQRELHMGNLEAKRDWGFAGDYVKAMWLMLQAKEPKDYVIATGETHSVRDFIQDAFSHAGLDWQKYYRFDPRYLRPTEVNCLLGNPVRAMKDLGWAPSVEYRQLVEMMVEADRGL